MGLGQHLRFEARRGSIETPLACGRPVGALQISPTPCLTTFELIKKLAWCRAMGLHRLRINVGWVFLGDVRVRIRCHICENIEHTFTHMVSGSMPLAQALSCVRTWSAISHVCAGKLWQRRAQYAADPAKPASLDAFLKTP
jgi:hypothetical protein